MTPLGSRTWKARSPHSSERSGMVIATGAGHRAAYDSQHAYDFGLQTILAGLAALLDPSR
jgi:hypothetical protein